MKTDETEGLQKHTLNLYRGDFDRLQSVYPDIPAGKVIRRIVRGYIERLESTTVELPKMRIETL
jgi:hypothetical protein